MNPEHIVSLLFQRGAALSVNDGQLLVDAPDGALDEALIQLLRQHKAAIITLVQILEAGTGNATVPVVRQSWPDRYEVATSLAQRRMLFMEELAENSSYYNIPVAYRIDGPLNVAALRYAMTHLTAEHDVLRTVYVLREHQYVQSVEERVELTLIEENVVAHADPEGALQNLLLQEANHVFDLACEWPIRIALITLRNNCHVLSLNLHHIAADGWSAHKIIADIGSAYHSFLHGRHFDGAVAGLNRPYQYADYVQWQTAWQQSAACQEARTWWSTTLAGAPQLHSLQTDFTRPMIQQVAGQTWVHRISPALSQMVEQGARQARTTPFVLFQTVFAALLARYSGESDIVFGTAAANRQPVEFMQTVGLFVNTLVLRYQLADNGSFADLLQQAMAVSEGAFRYQQFPFDMLVEHLQPARSLGYNPLVQLMLVMQEDAADALVLEGTQVTRLEQRQSVSKFDIAVHVTMQPEGIRLNWEYNTSLFREETIQRMAHHFERLLDAALTIPEQAIDSIALVDTDDPGSVMDAAAFPPVQRVERLFEASVAQHPDAIALRMGKQVMSYRELDARANRVAQQLLQEAGPQPGRIGVCMERTPELVIALLGICKAGGVYVPLDPYYPRERLEFMMADTGMTLLLTGPDSQLPEGLGDKVRQLTVDASVALVACNDTVSAAALAQDAERGAYIIFTSGSTGKPKGVLVSHRALFYSLHANSALMQFAARDSMPTIGSQAFGVSLLEIFLPLMTGGEVCLLKKSQIADMQQLVSGSNEVTVLHAVPSLMQQWLDFLQSKESDPAWPRPYPNLRLLLVGGESVPDGLLKKLQQWRPEVRLLELYGMTESAIVCSSFEPAGTTLAHYCIGKPHPNAIFCVLNRHGEQQPIGVAGELHIGGLSLATEYINQPAMTDEKFISHRLARGGRLYRTGDRVRKLADGHFEFLGRIDNQVSLRGARIEMGEIEMLASAVEGVRQAVAHVIDLGDDEKTLVLYFTAIDMHAEPRQLAAAIRNHLAQHLPDYMRPSLIE
ncbi:MAG: hypothetical protein RL748_949, partial [Pseudomonadota bacterium]